VSARIFAAWPGELIHIGTTFCGFDVWAIFSVTADQWAYGRVLLDNLLLNPSWLKLDIISCARVVAKLHVSLFDCTGPNPCDARYAFT
jgi:hypothetical protein